MTSVDAPAFVEPTAAPEPTDEAPFGLKADGTPYKRSAEWRQEAAARMSAGRTNKARNGGTPPPRKRAAPKARTPQAKKVITYADTVAGVMQMLAGGLMIAGRLMPVMKAHAVALTMHAEPISEAAQAVALEDPRVAAMLDKVAKVGPYPTLLLALVPLGMQMMANHGFIPPNPDLGVYDPHELLKEAGISDDTAGSNPVQDADGLRAA